MKFRCFSSGLNLVEKYQNPPGFHTSPSYSKIPVEHPALVVEQASLNDICVELFQKSSMCRTQDDWTELFRSDGFPRLIIFHIALPDSQGSSIRKHSIPHIMFISNQNCKFHLVLFPVNLNVS